MFKIGRPTPSPLGRSASGSEWQFQILLFKLILADQLADLSPWVFLLLELIWTDQLADLPWCTSTSTSEWQFHISTVRVLL